MRYDNYAYKQMEPFAWGYIHAGEEDKHYRTANGIKAFAEELDVSINTEDWFQSPLGAFASHAVHYSRSDGITLIESIKEKNAVPRSAERHRFILLSEFRLHC